MLRILKKKNIKWRFIKKHSVITDGNNMMLFNKSPFEIFLFNILNIYFILYFEVNLYTLAF